MSTYGIDKVRGGTYVNEFLDDNQIFNLKKKYGAQKIYAQNAEEIHIGLLIVMKVQMSMDVI